MWGVTVAVRGKFRVRTGGVGPPGTFATRTYLSEGATAVGAAVDCTSFTSPSRASHAGAHRRQGINSEWRMRPNWLTEPGMVSFTPDVLRCRAQGKVQHPDEKSRGSGAPEWLTRRLTARPWGELWRPLLPLHVP